MSRRNANEYIRKQPDYPIENIYQEYYSEMDLSMARNAQVYETPRHYMSRPRPKAKKNLADKFKKLALKANETFQKTFNREVPKSHIGRSSVTSLPEALSAHTHPSQHRRVMSVRPLPTIPPAPVRGTHQRRPTGPRELPMDLKDLDDKKSKMDELKDLKNITTVALEELCNLVAVNLGLQDPRVEQNIANKMHYIKETITKLEIHVLESMSKRQDDIPEPTMSPDDDQLTAVPGTSRSSSADSIEHLKKLTQNLVHEVTRTRKAPRAA